MTHVEASPPVVELLVPDAPGLSWLPRAHVTAWLGTSACLACPGVSLTVVLISEAGGGGRGGGEHEHRHGHGHGQSWVPGWAGLGWAGMDWALLCSALSSSVIPTRACFKGLQVAGRGWRHGVWPPEPTRRLAPACTPDFPAPCCCCCCCCCSYTPPIQPREQASMTGGLQHSLGSLVSQARRPMAADAGPSSPQSPLCHDLTPENHRANAF